MHTAHTALCNALPLSLTHRLAAVHSAIQALARKREMFRERMAKRKIQGEVNEAILDIGKSRRPPEDDDVLDEEDDSGDESDADLEVDDQGDSTEVAMIESQVIEIIASAHKAAQGENWSEVLDCSAQLEDRLARAKGKVAACATAARVLLNTGLKHASGFSDEPRVRSTLGCLMLIEWCVPTCPEAFRQAVSGERWVRKLVDLCRKDNTDAALVGTTVMQLVSNWSDWYASQPACAGFEKACEMLSDDGYDLPAPAARDEGRGGGGGGSEAGMPGLSSPSSSSSGAPVVPGLTVPGLQLNLGQMVQDRSSSTPSYLGQQANAGEDAGTKVQAELDIMREDVRFLDSMLSRVNKLSATELADAAQAATDTRGWRSRLAALMTKYDKKKQQVGGLSSLLSFLPFFTR